MTAISIDPVLHSPILQRLAWTLVHSIWQDTTIAMGLGLLLAAMPRSARARYLASCAALLCALLVGIGTFATLDAGKLMALSDTAHSTIGSIDSTPPRTPIASDSNWRDSLLPWTAVAWIFGVATLCIHHIGGWLSIQSMRRQTVVIHSDALIARLQALANRMGIHRIVLLCESSLVQVPSVIGWWRPMILYPARR